jgi:methionine synthase I (cobalamin-dependent)
MTKNDFLKLISSKIVILDGATGTELVKRGMQLVFVLSYGAWEPRCNTGCAEILYKFGK